MFLLCIIIGIIYNVCLVSSLMYESLEYNNEWNLYKFHSYVFRSHIKSGESTKSMLAKLRIIYFNSNKNRT